MPNYVPYRDDIETIEPDEPETRTKIIAVMTEGMHLAREKHGGKPVRISHAKAHGLLKGKLIVNEGLPPELAQGLFARPTTYPALVRISHAPGEVLDDSKISAPRGIAIKVFNVEGPHLPPFEGITTQDFVLDTGKAFHVGGPKVFLQSFKPNAKIAARLPEAVKGAVSDVARGAHAALAVVGMEVANLDFFGHPKKHPLEEPYYSQTPYRYGDYIAKIGVVPASTALKALEGRDYDPKTYDAFRESTVALFRTQGAEFDVVVELRVQLCTSLEKMPVEDASVQWPEDQSPYRSVARSVLPPQDAYEPPRADVADIDLSFSPAHSLTAHRPLGGINRARMTVYKALADRRRQENQRPTEEPTSLDQIPG